MKPPPPAYNVNIKLEGILSKITWKIRACVSSLKGTSHKTLFCFLFYISFYSSRYHFLPLFGTSFNINCKKIFITNFPSLTDSLKLSTPLTAKICQAWQKLFVNISQRSCQASLPEFTSPQKSSENQKNHWFAQFWEH